MTSKKSNKRQKRSTKNFEEIYSESPSPIAKIRYYLSLPNVRLQLTLRKQTLTNNMQEELATTLLGKACKFPKNENQIEPQFNRYIWDLKIIHGRQFKERLNQYKQKHIDVDINSHQINSALRVVQFLLYVIASSAGALNIIDHVINITTNNK